MPEWEKVNETCERLQVPGGWLYRNWLYTMINPLTGMTNRVGVTTNYVPDPHRWRNEFETAMKRSI